MFSATSDYALRALICLAGCPPGHSLLGGEISRQSEVPPNYLSKILYTLKHAGLVEATRGTGGGYRLKRRANDIRLVEVAEVFEGPRARLGCLLGKERECSDERACTAHGAWRRIRSEYMDFMERTTLAEVSGDMPAACLAQDPSPMTPPAYGKSTPARTDTKKPSGRKRR